MDGDFLARIQELIKEGKNAGIRNLIERPPPHHLARLPERLDRNSLIAFFHLIDTDQAADVLFEIDDATRNIILGELENDRISQLVKELDSDDAADILADMEPEDRQAVISRLPAEDRRDVGELLQYPEVTAGWIMSVDFIQAYTSHTVKQVISRLRRQKREATYTSILFVTDRKGGFEGSLRMEKLLFNTPKAKIKDLMEPFPAKVFVPEDQESVAAKAQKSDMPALPVVDEQDKLRGIITIDNIIDVIQEEAAEDIYRSGGVGRETSLFESPGMSAIRRFPWLFVNLVTASIAAAVVGLFQSTIKSLITVFLPIVAGIGGNAGTQTVVMVVRSLALGEITTADAWRLLRRQILTCLLLGLGAGILVGAGAFLFKFPVILSPLVFLALTMNILLRGFIGTLVPMLLRQLKLDPSIASGILLTATTDTLGFLTLLGLAALALRFFPA